MITNNCRFMWHNNDELHGMNDMLFVANESECKQLEPGNGSSWTAAWTVYSWFFMFLRKVCNFYTSYQTDTRIVKGLSENSQLRCILLRVGYKAQCKSDCQLSCQICHQHLNTDPSGLQLVDKLILRASSKIVDSVAETTIGLSILPANVDVLPGYGKICPI